MHGAEAGMQGAEAGMQGAEAGMQKTDAGSSTHRADKKVSIRGTDIRRRAFGRKLLIVGAGLCSVVGIMLAVNIFGSDPAIRESSFLQALEK